jgi:1-deoxy-D-xylulose-5-phosphate reductoisomerase
MKKLSILGSTGSIGVNTLEIIAKYPDRFQVVALAGGDNLPKMEEQILRFHPNLVSVRQSDAARVLRERLGGNSIRVLSGTDGLIAAASHSEAQMVVSALGGSIGLLPTLAAIRAGKTLALANKESLVMAGEILLEEARANGIQILPIDSEHSAIFQAMAGHRKEDIKKIILTASGGPFLFTRPEQLKEITPEQALKHPQWRMGKKVTIDSASLMNKGLEVVEAHWLFGVSPSQIEVYIHPQSIVHSMVEYKDGAIVAQMAVPDMRGPIAYALSYPERLELDLPSLDLSTMGTLSFCPVEEDRFPALGLAYQALERGETMPTVLNAANEIAVDAFLQRKLGFLEIPRVIQKTMERHHPADPKSLENILQADAWAREEAQKLIKNNKRGKL